MVGGCLEDACSEVSVKSRILKVNDVDYFSIELIMSWKLLNPVIFLCGCFENRGRKKLSSRINAVSDSETTSERIKSVTGYVTLLLTENQL